MQVTAQVCQILKHMCHSEWPPYYIVPHLNDKWFFFHKFYHPKLLWFIHMVQWYGEILILAHFASDGTCQILKPMCHSEWPPYYCSTFKWQVIFFFHKLYYPKLLWFINMVQWYCEILIWVHFASDVTCQILKRSVIPSDHCIIVTHFKWQYLIIYTFFTAQWCWGIFVSSFCE